VDDASYSAMVKPNPEMVNRRTALGWAAGLILGAISATLAVIVGGAVVSPRLGRRRDTWLDAAALDAVTTARPLEVALRVEREDGYRVTTERRVVYLVSDGYDVRALSAVCTHLGCRVAWHDAEKQFKCPCHGGCFSQAGAVVAGPPPRPLDALPARIDAGRIWVQV